MPLFFKPKHKSLHFLEYHKENRCFTFEAREIPTDIIIIYRHITSLNQFYLPIRCITVKQF